jgi:hypothetical protein
MAGENANANREFWNRQAEQVRFQVNLAWWLETFTSPLVALSIIGAFALIWVRRDLPQTAPWVPLAVVCAAVLLLGLACLAMAARGFERTGQSLVRIEAAMRLRNALSAAAAGVAPWPAPVTKADAGLKWRWPRLLVPVIGALALLAAGMWIPVSRPADTAGNPPDQPQAWKQLSSELDHLKEEQLADEKYIEETRKKLKELEAQKEDQWFSHSSLEATDTLKKSHRAETERVEKELGKAEKALGNLEKNAGSAGQAEKDRMVEEFDKALHGLQNGAMKPNPELLEQMNNLDLKNLADLSPEQMQQLRDKLQENADALKKASGQGEGGEWDDEMLADGDGDGNGNGGDGNDGDGTGQGGVDRGPGHDPSSLGKKKDPLKTGEMAGLQAKDLSHATPGDLLQLQDGEHEVDRSASKLSAGGGTEATGKGGDRVWRESLDPDEQRVLKRFFE